MEGSYEGEGEGEGVPTGSESSPDKRQEQEVSAYREFCQNVGPEVFDSARQRVREEGGFTK